MKLRHSLTQLQNSLAIRAPLATKAHRATTKSWFFTRGLATTARPLHNQERPLLAPFSFHDSILWRYRSSRRVPNAVEADETLKPFGPPRRRVRYSVSGITQRTSERPRLAWWVSKRKELRQSSVRILLRNRIQPFYPDTSVRHRILYAGPLQLRALSFTTS